MNLFDNIKFTNENYAIILKYIENLLSYTSLNLDKIFIINGLK